MKALSILGSPKSDRNTSMILSEIERALKELGFEITRYCLGQCDINYCIGCKCCDDTGECVQSSDDVQPIINDLMDSDIVLVASPSYWGDVTGQMKVFIDRCTPYCNVNHTDRILTTGTKGVAIAVRAGKNKKENENLINTFEHFLGHLNIPLVSSFTAEGVDKADDLKNNPEILKEAYDFGKKLLETIK